MNKSNWLTLLGLLLYCLLIFLPPLVHGYVYPNIGDDSAVYLARIEDMGAGLVSPQYTGYSFIGYPMLWLRDTIGWDIDMQFLWFNFIALALSGIVIYLVFSWLVNRLTGWLALLLTLFCAQGTLFLFYYGQIFNLINMCIIFPLLLLFLVKYLNNGRWHHLVLLLVISVVFSCFHTNGIYLSAIAGFGTLVYVIYGRVCKKKVEKRILYFGGGITAMATVVFVFLVLVPTVTMLREYSDTPLSVAMSNVGKSMAVPIQSWLMSILSPTLLVLFALSMVYCKDIVRLFSDRRVKIAGFVLVVFISLLALVTFTKLSLDPWRQALDLATVFALFVTVCLGLLLSKQKSIALAVIVVMAVGFGLFHNLPTWFSYNSAIQQADYEAMDYADNYETFSCSSQVAYWVYERHTTATHLNNGGDIVIMRDKPMTPRSTEDNMWYQGHGWTPSNEYELVKIIDDGEVEIRIWELMDWARESREIRAK